MSGLGVIGNDKYVLFPLTEIKRLMVTIGLRYDKTYKKEEDLKSVRYQHILMMTDQDPLSNGLSLGVLNMSYQYIPSKFRS